MKKVIIRSFDFFLLGEEVKHYILFGRFHICYNANIIAFFKDEYFN